MAAVLLYVYKRQKSMLARKNNAAFDKIFLTEIPHTKQKECSMQKNIIAQAMAQQQWQIQLRRSLHANAEIAFQLTDTVGIVKRQLSQMQIPFEDCGKSGVVAWIGNPRSKKVIVLRADMDGLPMYENTGKKYACKTGNMHACGHDIHTAAVLGAAKLIKQQEARLQGCVKLLFQPAEEILQGASDMIDSGALKNPKPQAALAMHVSTGVELPTGTVVLSSREVAAPAADFFQIDFHGKSCHGATPDQGADALLAAAYTVVALQTLSAREQQVDDPFVLTVGKLHAGSAGNAIADKAQLQGTMRAYSETTRERIKTRLQEIVKAQAKSVGVTAKLTFTGGCPTLKNNQELVALAKSCAETLFPDRKVLITDGRGGGSEDFAYISQELPSVLMVIAAGQISQGYKYPLHHPKTQFDESVLPISSALLASIVEEWLKK